MQQETVYVVNGRFLQVVKELGEGGFATVYAVQDVETKEPYALKRMVTADSVHQSLAEKEISLLQSLRHPNIVDMIGHACNPLARGQTEYLIQMELCTGGTLLEHILKRGQRKWPEAEICNIFSQVCCAVEVLHSQSPPLAHRDLKTENILLCRSGRWKLIDFGSCTTRAKKYTTTQEMHEEEHQIQKYSTPMYRAPEMADLYQKQLINEKVDIWALGCILYCMLFLLHPFQEGGSLVILNGCPSLPEHSYSAYPRQILKRLFAVRVSKRPAIGLVIEYCKKWKKFLDGNGDPDPDFSSHHSQSRRSKSGKSGDRKKSSRRSAKTDSKAPAEQARNRSRTTGASNRQVESDSESVSDSEDDLHKGESKKSITAPPSYSSVSTKPGSDDSFDFQWVADWKPFEDTPKSQSVPSTSQAGTTAIPDLLWFSDAPPQPTLQAKNSRTAPPPPIVSRPPSNNTQSTSTASAGFSASQAYQQALLSSQPNPTAQTVGSYYPFAAASSNFASQPMYQQYPSAYSMAPQQYSYNMNSNCQPSSVYQQPPSIYQQQQPPPPVYQHPSAYQQQSQQSFILQSRGVAARPGLELPQQSVRRQTAPPLAPQTLNQPSQHLAAKPNPPSPTQAELDFDLAFR